MTDTWFRLTWTRRVLLSLGVPPAAGPGHDSVYREVCGARSQRAVLLHHPSIAALSTCTVRQHDHVTGTALHATNLGRLPESTDSAAIFSVQREKRIRKLTGSERGRRDQFGNVPLTAVARGEGVIQVQGWSLRGDKLNSTSRSQTPLGLCDFMTRGRLLLISVLISVLTTNRSGGAALLVGDEAFLLAGGRPSPRAWRGVGGASRPQSPARCGSPAYSWRLLSVSVSRHYIYYTRRRRRRPENYLPTSLIQDSHIVKFSDLTLCLPH